MPRVKSAKDLPENVFEFESTPEGDIVFGKELTDLHKQQRMNAAKKELAETDTLGNKAKARLQDVGSGLSTILKFGSKSKGINPSDHEEKVERLKKEAKGLKAGGKVSSASKRADGCCAKGKTKGRYL